SGHSSSFRQVPNLVVHWAAVGPEPEEHPPSHRRVLGRVPGPVVLLQHSRPALALALLLRHQWAAVRQSRPTPVPTLNSIGILSGRSGWNVVSIHSFTTFRSSSSRSSSNSS